MDLIEARYRLWGSRADVERIATEIAHEQTVEVPPALAEAHPQARELVARVLSVEPVGEQAWQVSLGYRADLASGSVAQLMNLVYGNVSLQPPVSLVELSLPKSVLAHYSGPNHGMPGLRKRLGVTDTPLLATAIKPRGATHNELAAIAGRFARGGGHLVKDDHNLVEPSFEAYCDRVLRCRDAVKENAAKAGTTCLYLPNLSGTAYEVARRTEWLRREHCDGVLVAPLLLGLETVHELARSSSLVILAHPTMTGSLIHSEVHGIDPAILLGTIFRLIGCDGTIFPNSGGRFPFTPALCRRIASRALEPLAAIPACCPVPAGGMSYESLASMAELYGPEAMFLIGGALLTDSDDLAASTQRFRERLAELFQTSSSSSRTPIANGEPGANAAAVAHGSSAQADFVSACELPGTRMQTTTPAVAGAVSTQAQLWRCGDDFQWDGRQPTVYKTNRALPFANVSRTELVGRAGEQTAFELRYFEIGPDGHSSLEQHHHTHVILGARGTGVLIAGDRELAVGTFDVAYVPPRQVHQLVNRSSEPFGFFCIVDRERDVPVAPGTLDG